MVDVDTTTSTSTEEALEVGMAEYSGETADTDVRDSSGVEKRDVVSTKDENELEFDDNLDLVSPLGEGDEGKGIKTVADQGAGPALEKKENGNPVRNTGKADANDANKMFNTGSGPS